MGFWPVVKRVLKDADFVLVILDVRMPEFFENKELKRMIDLYKKKVFVVFNKIDLVSKDFLDKVKDRYEGAFFVSGTNNLGIAGMKKELQITAKREKIKEPLIGVVGYPNVGKSAIINALAKRGKARVGRHAGTTKGIQWVKAGGLRVMDSPGVVPIEDSEIKLGIMGAKNPEKLRDPERTAYRLIGFLKDIDSRAVEEHFSIELEGDEDEVLENIGRNKGFLKKGGVVDMHRTAMYILREWQKGRIKI